MTTEKLLDLIEFYASAHGCDVVAHIHGDAEGSARFEADAKNALAKIREEIERLTKFEGALTIANKTNARLAASTHAKLVEKVRDCHRVQGDHGNWNYSGYMRGLYNGLELALSILEGERQPVYRDQPDQYLEDLPDAPHAPAAELPGPDAATDTGTSLSNVDTLARDEQIDKSTVNACPRCGGLDGTHTMRDCNGLHCSRCQPGSCDGCFYCRASTRSPEEA